MATRRQIIAIGGGGFSLESDTSALEKYVLAQARTPNPTIAFLPTAGGDADASIARFYDVFSRLECRPSVLRFFARTPDLRNSLLGQNIIFVGGGNTKSMLAVWREWGVPALLRTAWRSGVVLAGSSAGGICWFDVGITDSWATRLAPLPCLGLGDAPRTHWARTAVTGGAPLSVDFRACQLAPASTLRAFVPPRPSTIRVDASGRDSVLPLGVARPCKRRFL